MTQQYPIRLLRMMTGEMLMSGISDGGKESYILEQPMLLIAVQVSSKNTKPDEPEEVSVMLKDWIDFSSDNYIIVPKRAVMCIVRPNRDIVSDYLQAKMNSDIVGDIIESQIGMGDVKGKKIEEVMDDEEEDDEEFKKDKGEEEETDEFPGWGGDPRL